MIFLKIFNLKKILLYEGHGRLARWINPLLPDGTYKYQKNLKYI